MKLTQQLQEAQNVAQSTKGMTQTYERQLAEVHEQMKALEHLLIEQRQKGNSLSSQLSASPGQDWWRREKCSAVADGE